MNKLEEQMIETEMQGEFFRLALESGAVEWEDERIQFFIPIILHFTNFDWLKLIAKHNLVKEDEIVVNNFLDMVQSLMKINETNLEQAVKDKIGKMMGEL